MSYKSSGLLNDKVHQGDETRNQVWPEGEISAGNQCVDLSPEMRTQTRARGTSPTPDVRPHEETNQKARCLLPWESSTPLPVRSRFRHSFRPPSSSHQRRREFDERILGISQILPGEILSFAETTNYVDSSLSQLLDGVSIAVGMNGGEAEGWTAFLTELLPR
jgi:hypothetical protein